MSARIEHDPLEIVSTERLERELTLARGAADGSLAGVFGLIVFRCPSRATTMISARVSNCIRRDRRMLASVFEPVLLSALLT